MHIFHSTTRRIIFFTLIAVLLLAVSGSIALAASNGLEPTKDLFTPSLSQGSLYPTAEQDMPRYVDVNLSLLDNAVQGDALGLNLYADVYFTAILQRKEVTQPDGYAWVGYLQGVEFSQVILVVGGGQMAGNITSPLGQYQVRYAGDGLHAIYTVDQSTFPPELPPIPVDAEVVAQPNQPEAPDLCTAIDVMVVWTPNARSAAGGTTPMQNLVNLAVTETNQSYINSNMTQRINLVHSQEVSYTESGDFGTDLGRLQHPSDGFIDNVHTLRNTHQADLVSMFIEGAQYCGIGYFMNTVSPSFESYAFTVVARNCATGYYSFAHEMGHNEGARHDWYVDTGITPFDYAHGYVNPPDRWRTIMAYDNECSAGGFNCTRLQYWSNPGILYGGDPMGVPAGSFHPADDHLALNNTCSTVANFRDSPDSPGAFNKTSPANSATGVSTSPTLSWGSSTDATKYYYCIDTSNNNTCNATWVDNGASTSIALSGLPGGTTYYWHVYAFNASGTTYSNSDTWWSFTTGTASSGPLVFDHYILYDDNAGNSLGNSNGLADCGETIEMYAYLQNAGSLAINGVSAEISTSDTHVVWPYNRASSYGNMAGGAVVANADDFDFVIDPDTPDGHLLHFDLDITSSTGGFWEDEFDVPVSCRPDIAVNPPAFTFFLPPNSSASSALGIHNPGGALNWNMVVGVNPSVGGQWNMHYDWACIGTPGSVVLTFAPDHTFVSSSGASGTWSMAGSQITWVYTNGTSYTGWIAGEYMAGAMRTVDNSEGCWNADRVFADVAPLLSGDLTDSGELAPQPGAVSQFTPQDAGKVQKVAIDPAFTPTPLSGFDRTTRLPVASAPHTGLSLDPALAGSGNVLWDLTHGVYSNYQPSGAFSSLVTLLNGAGFTVYTTSAGVENVDLSAYNVLVVNVASNWNSAYTPAEVAAIKAFVFNGGGLLVMGDNPGTPNSNLQPVSQAFGATLGVSATAPLDLYITNFASHPLFSGMASIYYRASGELTAVSPSSLIAWDPSNKGAVAVASYGGGKVLVLGEATNWDNTYLGYANNQQFALNVFNWLSRWLSATPLTGTVLPGQTITDNISVDSTGLSAGAYYGGLAILSDAYPPGKSPLIVPVTLIVGDHRINLPFTRK